MVEGFRLFAIQDISHEVDGVGGIVGVIFGKGCDVVVADLEEMLCGVVVVLCNFHKFEELVPIDGTEVTDSCDDGICGDIFFLFPDTIPKGVESVCASFVVDFDFHK